MRLPQTIALSSANVTYSDGIAGVFQTVRVMRRLVNESKIDPYVRHSAATLCYLTPPKDYAGEAAALFDYVQKNIRYLKDVHNVETIATPAKTLQTRYGDCDDQAALLAALLESIGHPTRFVVAGYNTPGVLEHVYLQTWINNDWIACDTTEPNAFGWEAPNPVCIYYEDV